jgi:hypothetical protein
MSDGSPPLRDRTAFASIAFPLLTFEMHGTQKRINVDRDILASHFEGLGVIREPNGIGASDVVRHSP